MSYEAATPEQVQYHYTCSECITMAGDEVDNTFRLLFNHHPLCWHFRSQIEDYGSVLVDKETFIKNLERISDEIQKRKNSNLITEAVEAEREACARIADEWDSGNNGDNSGEIADEIRRRNNK